MGSANNSNWSQVWCEVSINILGCISWHKSLLLQFYTEARSGLMTTQLLVHANSNSVDLGSQTRWGWLAKYQTEQEGKWMWWSKVAEVGTARPDVCQMCMQRIGLREGGRLALAKPWSEQPRGKDQNGEVCDFSDTGRGCWCRLRTCWNLHHITTDFKVYGEWTKK